MTKQEALELLDLEENSSSEKIERSYKQLFSEYRLRLDNAPTAHLKALYQKNLKRLEEAYELLRVKEPENEILDLPTATPLLQIEKEPKISVQKLETETQKKEELKTIESSIIWKWIHSNDEKVKDELMKQFIKLRYGI